MTTKKITNEWESIDKLIEEERLEPVDKRFAEAALRHKGDEGALFLSALFYAAREGHACLKIDEKGSSLFGTLKPIVHSWVKQEENRYYLKRHFVVEKKIIREWKRLGQQPPTIAFKPTGLKALEEKQFQAALKVGEQSITLITGGPGTGKTQVASALLKAFAGKGIMVAAAPTGKAAANLKMRLGELCEVKTLHSLLKRGWIDADFVLVDECSMIDALLFSKLLAAIKSGTRLVLLGDPDQLPPVEVGAPFSDLVAQGGAHISRLTKIFRTDIQAISQMAEEVKMGKVDQILQVLKPLPTQRELVNLIIAQKGHTHFLNPLRKGAYGVDVLNQRIASLQKGEPTPILIAANDDKTGLYNGDVGILDGERAFFGEKKLPRLLLPKYEYAYVLSVHKSQGSEYDYVAILLPEHSVCFGKRMLYTALTRARKGVAIYSSEEILRSICQQSERRLSGI